MLVPNGCMASSTLIQNLILFHACVPADLEAMPESTASVSDLPRVLDVQRFAAAREPEVSVSCADLQALDGGVHCDKRPCRSGLCVPISRMSRAHKSLEQVPSPGS